MESIYLLQKKKKKKKKKKWIINSTRHIFHKINISIAVIIELVDKFNIFYNQENQMNNL